MSPVPSTEEEKMNSEECHLSVSSWRNMAHIHKDYNRLLYAATQVCKLPLNQGQSKDFYDALEELRVVIALGVSP